MRSWQVDRPGRAEGAGNGAKAGNQIFGYGNALNTLQSRANVYIVDALGEGVLALTNGAQSIFFNNTPLENPDGTANFDGVTWTFSPGLPYPLAQALSNYPAAEFTQAVNMRVWHGAPVIQRFQNPAATSARVTVQIPALFRQDSSQGTLLATSLQYQIWVRPVEQTAWQQVANINLHDQKCTSLYEKESVFPLPASPSYTWEVKVSRFTPDYVPTPNSTGLGIANQLYWSLLGQITDQQMTYADTAYIALTFDAALFGGTLPSRSYFVQRSGLLIPANYNPATRVYATLGAGTSNGTWDGTFTTGVSDNPAWILYDLLSDTRYGFGLSDSQLAAAKWDLYTIGQYCDQPVPDGLDGGTTEPRYTFNGAITTQDDAYRVAGQIAAAFRGFAFWTGGTVKIVADMPSNILTGVTEPVSLLTKANVIGGNFRYQGTSVKARHTSYRVGYMDPTNYYQPTTHVHDLPTQISMYGLRPAQWQAFGCTSEGAALRFAKWAEYKEWTATRMVTYQAALDQIQTLPGDVVAVMDPNYAGVRAGGRVAAADTTNILLDAIFIPEPGPTYTISLVMPDGTIQYNLPIAGFSQPANGLQESTQTVPGPAAIAGGASVYQASVASVVGASGTTQVSLQTALPVAPLPNSVWMIQGGAAAQLYRVQALSERQPGIVDVTAELFDANAFAAIEQDIFVQSIPFTTLPSFWSPLDAPTNVLADYFMVGEGTTTTQRLAIGWTPPADGRVTAYDVTVTGSATSVSPLANTANATTPNLIANPHFATAAGVPDVSNWTVSPSTDLTGATATTAGVPPSAPDLTVGILTAPEALAALVPIFPGATYLIGGSFACPAGNSVQFGAQVVDANGANPRWVAAVTEAAAAGGGWLTVSGTITMPITAANGATAAQAAFGVLVEGPAGGFGAFTFGQTAFGGP